MSKRPTLASKMGSKHVRKSFLEKGIVDPFLTYFGPILGALVLGGGFKLLALFFVSHTGPRIVNLNLSSLTIAKILIFARSFFVRISLP